MKTLVRLALAAFLLLLCFSAMNTVVAILVPSLRSASLPMQPFLYNAETMVAAPVRIELYRSTGRVQIAS